MNNGMPLRKPLKTIIKRERNVLCGFCVFTLLVYLIHKPLWIYALLLYFLHLVTMAFYYTRVKKD